MLNLHDPLLISAIYVSVLSRYVQASRMVVCERASSQAARSFAVEKFEAQCCIVMCDYIWWPFLLVCSLIHLVCSPIVSHRARESRCRLEL